MERLTKRYTYNRKPEISADSEVNGISCSNFCTSCGKADCEDIRKALFKLAEYEDLEEQGKLLQLPCAVGDTVYTNVSMQGWYFNRSKRPYEAKVAFIGINGYDKFMNVDFGNGYMLQFKFWDIGKIIFFTKEEAEAALKEGGI